VDCGYNPSEVEHHDTHFGFRAFAFEVHSNGLLNRDMALCSVAQLNVDRALGTLDVPEGPRLFCKRSALHHERGRDVAMLALWIAGCKGQARPPGGVATTAARVSSFMIRSRLAGLARHVRVPG
jgi:hypothetical protein